MIRFRSVLIGVLLSVLYSCDKEYVYDLTAHPILFSPYQDLEVEVRGEAVTDFNNKSFGVRGYKYGANWVSYAPLAAPDAKWKNTKVTCDANGVCTYAPIQDWENNMNYAFFGFYPDTVQANGALQLSTPDQKGIPSFTYNLSDAAVGKNNNGIGDPAEMQDVMYASVVDANEILSPVVELPFKHALFGVRVFVENFGEKAVKVESLALKLNLKHKGIKVSMDGSSVDSIPFKANNEGQVVQYQYIKKTNPPFSLESTLNLSPRDVSEGKILFLVPQMGLNESQLSVKIANKGVKNINLNYPNMYFCSGKMYHFYIQFIGEHLNVIVDQGTEWVDKDSDIEFE